MSVHQDRKARDSSLSAEPDSFMKDMNSGSGLNRKQLAGEGNDVEMLDALMKKLLDSKKLTKK